MKMMELEGTLQSTDQLLILQRKFEMPVITQWEQSWDWSQAGPPFPLCIQKEGLWVCSYICCESSLIVLVLAYIAPVPLY